VEKKNLKALFISIGLHIVLIAGLVLGDFTRETKPLKKISTPMKPIDAVLIDANKLQEAINKRNKIKKQKADKKAAEKKRLRQIEKRAEDDKKRRAKEKAKIKKREQQRKKKAQEKKRADKAAKDAKVKAAKQAKADKIRKQKKQERQKAEAAAAKVRSKRIKEEKAVQAKKAEELKKKKLAEKKRKELEAKERAIQEEFLAQEMAAEMATRNNARQQQLMSEVERYGALITNIINQNMISDRSTMEGKSCKLKISLASSGFVTDVKTISGDAVVCDAAERAVFKANTLPVSKDPEVFNKMRNIGVTVIPEF